MKSRILKAALVIAATMTMVLGATMVTNAQEAFVAPRLASNCNNVNCKGHVSVHQASSNLDVYVCVPNSWGKSMDEYRTAATAYYKSLVTETPAPVASPVGCVVVKKGDTLSKIAKAAYGDSKLWKVIYEANKATIKNPNKISVGQILVVPACGVAPVCAPVVCEPVSVPVPVAPVVTPVEKEAYAILQAKIQQTIDVHNAVVDAIDAGIVNYSDAAKAYIDNSADALNVIENIKAKDYTNISAYDMYNQMDAYIITITQLLK